MRHNCLAFVIVAFLICLIPSRTNAQLISTVEGGLNDPFGVAVDSSGNVYIADTYNEYIRVVNTGSKAITVANVMIQPGASGIVAGDGTAGYSGDNGPATGAQIYNPIGVAVDGSGNIYIADLYNFRVRKVNSSGIITTVAGTGTQNYGGDNGPAVNATLYPYAVATDSNGILYVADTYNQRIRVVNTSSKMITLAGVSIQPGNINTVAGNGLTGSSGDNGVATSAEFSDPYGLTVSGSGIIYICDTYSRRIRVVNTGTSPITVAQVAIPAGFINTVAGNGSYGFRGDGTLATNAEFSDPDGVGVDGAGNIYISDLENERIRMVTNATGLISTIAGNGTYGYNGDGIPAISALITYPRVVVADAAGNVYFVDEPNFRVRKIAVNPGVPAITSRAGTAFTVGVQGTFTVTTGDLPVSSLSAGTLPQGIAFVDNGNGTGTLSSNPTATAGTFNIIFTAMNGISPNAVQNFTLTIYPPGGAPTAGLVSEDFTTNGFWQGKYGADGFSLANSVQSIPAYSAFTVQNQKSYTWLTNTTDPRALQIPGGGTIAAAWYNNAVFDLDVNFTDGGSHQLAVYAVDWDGQGREEIIQVQDANSGVALDTETISNFSSTGVYLVWNIKGHVQIVITPIGLGANGIINGVFFGGQAGSSTPNLSITKTHAGNFAQGQQNATYAVTVSNGPIALPTTGTVTVTETVPPGLSLVSMVGTGTGWTCAANSCNRSDALPAGASYPPITVTVNVAANASSPQVNQVAVSGGGSASANSSDSTTIVAATGGIAAVTFVGSDTSTQGNWIALKNYGTDGYALANSVQSLPTYDLAFNTQNLTGWTWAPSTSDPRALKTDTNGDRIAAAWFNPGSFNLDVNLTDGKAHQIALYVMDWDSQGRIETVQILDAGSGATLDTRNIPNSNTSTTTANFSGGTYLIWTITGHVTISVAKNGGPNAVVSGIFFGGAAAPESVAATSGTPQSAAVGANFAPLVATVTSGGSPVSGAMVLFAAPSLGASGAFPGGNNTATVPANAQGVATAPLFTANATAGGPYTVTATVTGGSTAGSFLLTNVSLSGPPANITATGGASQSATVNMAFATQLQATVTDALNSPVPNVTVTFLAPSSGASGTFAGNTTTATTNAQGIATAQVFTANATVGGPYTVTATVTGASNAASFSLTNTQAPGCVGNCASFFSKDTSTEGNWKPMYGADGYSLANVAQSLPAYATFSVQNQASWTWASSTSDARALQIPGGSGGIAATWYSASSFFFDVNVGGSSRKFALYAVDWDGLGRSETIQIQDGITSAPLDTETISGFGTGVYLVWNITGHVKIVVTSTAGPNAVVSGIFFGGAPTPAVASFVKFDATTQGAWETNYGADGYSLAALTPPSIPSYAGLQVQNAVTFTWNSATTDPRALQIPDGSEGIAASWYNAGSFNFTINFTDGAQHQVAFYALDWTSSGRSETIQIVDATTNNSLDTETVANFTGGIYAVWNISGSVRIIVTTTGGSNAVVSGVFFGGTPPPAGASFVRKDATTQGTWAAKYGADGYSLAGVPVQKIPSYAAFQVENAQSYTWSSSTTDSRAVQIPGGSTGIAAAWYTTSSLSFDLNVGATSHPFALYLLDWDNQGRQESVQIVDAITNKLLDTETVSNFNNGIYLVWTITGHIRINIALTGGVNAVASGAFFN